MWVRTCLGDRAYITFQQKNVELEVAMVGDPNEADQWLNAWGGGVYYDDVDSIDRQADW